MLVYPPGIKTAEQRLVFCCARSGLSPELSAEVARLMGEELNWKQVLQFAQAQNLLPLLHKHLLAVGTAKWPPPIQKQLRDFVALHTKRNLQLTGELLRISGLMQEQGVTILAYKGPALAVAAYGNLGLRPCSDLDVLVRPQDLETARAVLVRNRYRFGTSLEDDEETELTSAKQAYVRIAKYEQPFIHENGQILLELHWAIAPYQFSFDLSVDKIWNRRVPSGLHASVATLSPEDLVLALCVHGAKHAWERLEWIACLASLLFEREPPHFDWGYLSRRATSTDTERILWSGLALAKQVALVSWPASMPISLVNAIEADKATRVLQDQVWQIIAQSSGDSPKISGHEQEMQRHLFLLTGLQGWKHRFRYRFRFALSIFFLWDNATRQEIQRQNLRGWRVGNFYLKRVTRGIFQLLSRARG